MAKSSYGSLDSKKNGAAVDVSAKMASYSCFYWKKYHCTKGQRFSEELMLHASHTPQTNELSLVLWSTVSQNLGAARTMWVYFTLCQQSTLKSLNLGRILCWRFWPNWWLEKIRAGNSPKSACVSSLAWGCWPCKCYQVWCPLACGCWPCEWYQVWCPLACVCWPCEWYQVWCPLACGCLACEWYQVWCPLACVCWPCEWYQVWCSPACGCWPCEWYQVWCPLACVCWPCEWYQVWCPLVCVCWPCEWYQVWCPLACGCWPCEWYQVWCPLACVCWPCEWYQVWCSPACGCWPCEWYQVWCPLACVCWPCEWYQVWCPWSVAVGHVSDIKYGVPWPVAVGHVSDIKCGVPWPAAVGHVSDIKCGDPWSVFVGHVSDIKRGVPWPVAVRHVSAPSLRSHLYSFQITHSQGVVIHPSTGTHCSSNDFGLRHHVHTLGKITKRIRLTLFSGLQPITIAFKRKQSRTKIILYLETSRSRDLISGASLRHQRPVR